MLPDAFYQNHIIFEYEKSAELLVEKPKSKYYEKD